jgi:NTP pyrophosphatase (non-canonical NTP hydrolase)
MDIAKPDAHADEEAADVLWMLLTVCNGLGIDLEAAFRAKDEHNKTRTWK